MTCPAGLRKATNYYNKVEAWKRWIRIRNIAFARGCHEMVLQLQPGMNDPWRTIDKASDELERYLDTSTHDRNARHNA